MKENKTPEGIPRRDFIKNTVIFTGGASMINPYSMVNKVVTSGTNRNKTSKPHILLIMTDQHRGDSLGCVNTVVNSPNIDSIAKDGVRFVNAYTASASCTPARAGLLTGLTPWHHGMLGYGRIAEKYKYEMPRMLREAGYYTFGIGKMHWFPQKTLHGFHGTLVDESGRVESPDFISDYRKWFKKQAPGVDPDATGIGWNEHRAGTYVLAEDLHQTYWAGQTAVDFINNYDKEKPMFLKVSFARPHSPYDPPKRFLDMYKDADIPAPVIGDWAEEFASFPETKNAAFGDFGVEHAKKSRKHYYASISFIDEQVGHILDALKARGMYDNALIMFTSDHGDMLGDHHHWRKTYAYQGSSNIPMLMKWPDSIKTEISRGSVLNNPVELRDFLPTFLDMAETPVPGDIDGANLLNLVRNESAPWREYIDMEHATCYRKENYWCALTDGKLKYIYFFYDGREQLFNLEKDPGELHNLSENKAWSSEMKKWRNRMIAHLSERGEGFVKGGKLQIRKETMLYSPNYPGK